MLAACAVAVIVAGGCAPGGSATPNTAAAPVAVPTLLMTAEGQVAFTRRTLEPRMSAIVRAVEVPKAGHWLAGENPAFVTSELLTFLAG